MRRLVRGIDEGRVAMSAFMPMFSRKGLFRLIWPLVVEQLLLVLVGVISVFMVASVGEATVSGVALVDSVNYLFIQVLFAFTAGGTVVCAQFIGARDAANASTTAAQLMLTSVAGMAVIAVIFEVGGEQLLALLFGAVGDDVMADAVVYMRYTVASFPFMALFYAVSSVFRAKGETRISMFAALFMNVLNIAGNAVCIFGLHMGVVGVALPTLLARVVASFGMVVLLQRLGGDVRIRALAQFRFNKDIVGKILSIGAPNAVESGLFNFGKVLLQSLVATLGTASIAAYAVASSLVTFLYLPGNALGAALLTIVGQCYGAGEHAQAKGYMKKMLVVNYAMAAVLAIILGGGAGIWVDFYGLSAEASSLAVQLVVAHSIAMALWPPAFLFPYYFRAVGRAKFTMVVAIVTMAVCRVGLAYLFVDGLGFGVLWVWVAMFADWAVRLVVYVVSFKKERPET